LGYLQLPQYLQKYREFLNACEEDSVKLKRIERLPNNKVMDNKPATINKHEKGEHTALKKQRRARPQAKIQEQFDRQ
jgi:hypothetical protein